jgi:hypothetical protein
MTVLDNVMAGAFLRHPQRNDAREHAKAILELTGLNRSLTSGALAWHTRTQADRDRAYWRRRHA